MEAPMTREQRAALMALMERQTRINTASQEVARAFFIGQGIYTEDGDLTSEYGGPEIGFPAKKPED
jgi:hypothetical protein